MLLFNEFLLLEVLDSEFSVNHDTHFKNWINNELKDKIYPGHTAVMGSDHMIKHGLSVLRLKNADNHIEYHILNSKNELGSLPKEKQNKKALLHALKIIHDDSKSYMERGDKIKLQAHDDHQYGVYKKIATNMIKGFDNKKVTETGKQPRLDGGPDSETLVIEGYGYGAVDWNKLLGRKIDENV